MRIVGIIQARDHSTRLLGKALADVNGLPVISHVYRRLSAVGMLDGIVVSTSTESPMIVDHCLENGWKYWTGSESNLLARHLGAAMTFDADAILRITCDCIFHDPSMLDKMLGGFIATKADALINWHLGNRTVSEGLDAEVISVATMAKLERDRNCPREDWVSHLDRSEKFRVMGWAYPERVGHELHLSLDTEEDLKRTREMMAILGNDEYRYQFTLKAWEMTQ